MTSRRQFLRTTSRAALATGAFGFPGILRAEPQTRSELGKVKIIDVQTATIRFRYDMHLVKVVTDSGLSGIGEAYNRAGVISHDLNLWFVEDPMPPGNADAFVRLTSASPIPIATGENLFTRQTFRPYIEQQACDIIQPDTQKCGGLLETKRIADWADLYYLNMLCHNMCSPVGTIASGHACLAIRSFVALESDSVEIPDWQHVVHWDGSLYKDGYLEIPNKPGLGIELNEEICHKHLSPGSQLFQ